MSKPYDFLVIGGGSGGMASARRAAQHGARVALVEAARLGGTCVNVGCVPKKLMWHAGQLAHALQDAPAYGFSPVGISHDWARLVQDREAYLRRLNGIYANNLDNDGIEVFEGFARFVDSHALAVGDQRLEAERILIATGSEPVVPEVPGAELGLDSDGFFALTARPQRVAVVGSGYIAVELAGVLRALGSEVDVVIRRDRVLRHFDSMLSEALMEEMRKQGIRLHTHDQVRGIQAGDHGLDVQLSDRGLAADALIWAIGRQPKLAGLGLDVVGLEQDANGHIVVDEWQATSQPHIFAVGDVTAAPALTPVAIKAGRTLADRLFGGQAEARLRHEHVPTVVFSHPAIATVGLSEDEARQRYGNAVNVYSGQFRALYNALLEHKVGSAVKLVVLGEEERVIGLHSIGPGSDELLQGFAVALAMGACKQDLDDCIAIHPTAAEELVTLR